jgi:predicted lipoprotein with Yx(FWY)xxD motif
VAVLVAIAAAAALSSGIAAAGGTPVVTAAPNQQLNETLVVDRQGHTLYALSPETAYHLLCKSHACQQIWPPVTVRSAKLKLHAGPGVQGRLGLLRRSSGKWQLTLRGRPLYRFSGDSAKGAANGEGIKSFGGTWHAVTGALNPTSPSTGTTTPPTPTPPTTPTPAPPSYPY